MASLNVTRAGAGQVLYYFVEFSTASSIILFSVLLNHIIEYYIVRFLIVVPIRFCSVVLNFMIIFLFVCFSSIHIFC